MHCIVRSADRTVVEGDAERIVARSPYGEFAVMEGHAPILAVLVPSVVRLRIDGVEQAIAVKGGTFSLEKNIVTVLAERPHKLDEIDVDSLREELTVLRATEPLTAAISEEIAYLELLCRLKENHA